MAQKILKVSHLSMVVYRKFILMGQKKFLNLTLTLKIQNQNGSYFVDYFVIQHKNNSLQQVLSTLVGGTDIVAAFPNLSKLATIVMVLPVHNSNCGASIQHNETHKNKAS